MTQPWQGSRLIPLVVIDEPSSVNPLLDAFEKAGLLIVEIGLRSEAALEAISIASRRDGFTVAAGTLNSPQNVKDAIAAGASFGLSPGSSEQLLDEVEKNNWPFIPAAATLTEAQQLVNRGFVDLKIYPLDLLGGAKFLSAISAVMPTVRMIPSGGVTEENLKNLLAQQNVIGVSGSWIAPRNLIAAKDFEEITKRAARAIKIANGND